jgi:hypothetical protein
VISGNDLNGVDLFGAGTSTNRIIGNIIGLDLNGDADLGNTMVGVAVALASTANIIGEAGSGNVISGNNQYGVRIVDAGTNNNLVQNNFIGLDITGTLARPNGIDGVRLEAAGPAPPATSSAGTGEVATSSRPMGARASTCVTSCRGPSSPATTSGWTRRVPWTAATSPTASSSRGVPPPTRSAAPWGWATSSPATEPAPASRGCGSTA